jgi:predicted transcriptional regulator
MIPVRLDPQLRDSLVAHAQQTERSQAWLIRRAIAEYLKRHAKESRSGRQ